MTLKGYEDVAKALSKFQFQNVVIEPINFRDIDSAYRSVTLDLSVSNLLLDVLQQRPEMKMLFIGFDLVDDHIPRLRKILECEYYELMLGIASVNGLSRESAHELCQLFLNYMCRGCEYSSCQMEVHLGRTLEWGVIVGAAINSYIDHSCGRSIRRLLISNKSKYCYGRDEPPGQRPISMILSHDTDLHSDKYCGIQCTLYWKKCTDEGISHLMGLFSPISSIAELEIIGNNDITSIGFDQIIAAAEQLPKLTSIRFENCPNIGGSRRWKRESIV
jgi:hypothetical protein